MLSASEDHALERRHVAIIPAPANNDVLIHRNLVIGGIEIYPAQFGYVDRKPYMGSIAADPFFLVGGWECLDVTADISCGKPLSTYTGDGEMRKILTYATPVFEHRRQWRGKCSEIRVVDKVGMYTYHQIVHGFKQGASG